jgi:hypothetical protein
MYLVGGLAGGVLATVHYNGRFLRLANEYLYIFTLHCLLFRSFERKRHRYHGENRLSSVQMLYLLGK